MFNQRLVRYLLPALFFASPLLAQSRSILSSSVIRADQLRASYLLLDSYQIRFVKSQLSLREFEYAQQYLCPQFPAPLGLHICNSSVVGTSEVSPDDIIPFRPGLIVKVPCLKCLLIGP